MAEGIVVEPALAGDVQRILAMDPRVADTPGRREFHERAFAAGETLVARRDRDMVGFVVLDRLFFGQRFIELLFVEPAHRRTGVATAMVRHIESLCPGEKLFTSTNESNVRMQAFCAALGFERSGSIDNLDEGDPELIYFKRAPAREGEAVATTEAQR